MKTLYFECSMGAAGDMILAALLGLIENRENFIREFNSIGLEGLEAKFKQVKKSGIKGNMINILINGIEEESIDLDTCHSHHCHEQNHHEHKHEHAHEYEYSHKHVHEYQHEHDHHHPSHNSYRDIEDIISSLKINDNVKKNSLAIYRLIAEAESSVHGVDVKNIHFHEVGNLDAIADIVGVSMLIDIIKPDKIICSPINVGQGRVRCAHGILPVPAPATALILKNVPIYSNDIYGELCTPTGGAILKHFTDSFQQMPAMKVREISYGMGKKDFNQINCVRVFLGQSPENQEKIYKLSCNIDDMTGEDIGYAFEKLLENKALDVYTIPIMMKKNRPGIILNVLCQYDKREKLIDLVFKHTTTLGIREEIVTRRTLDRQIEEIDTKYGKVHIKKSYGHTISKEKIEHDDLAKIARDRNIPLKEIKKNINR